MFDLLSASYVSNLVLRLVLTDFRSVFKLSKKFLSSFFFFFFFFFWFFFFFFFFFFGFSLWLLLPLYDCYRVKMKRCIHGSFFFSFYEI